MNIEEDINRVEILVKYGLSSSLTAQDIQAIENILAQYTKIKNENEEYKKQLDLDYVEKNYINRKEIKNKLEDYEERIRYYEDNQIEFDDEYYRCKTKVEILKELLEEEV